MSLITLMNNQPFTPNVFIYYTNILWTELSTKYIKTFGDNYYYAVSSFLIIIYTGISIVEYYNFLNQMKETVDQIRYIKKKNVILQKNIEFLLDNIANNEIKIIRLTKQVTKLKKEINEYA